MFDTPSNTNPVPTGRTVPLQTAQFAPFGVDGIATAILGPDRAGQTWTVTRLVSTISPAPISGAVATLVIGRNGVTPANIIDSTNNPTLAISETNFTLLEGERLYCIWSILSIAGSPLVLPNQQATIVVGGKVNY